MEQVGLIGIGLMGEPMAKNWIKKGFKLSFLANKNRGSATRLLDLGAHEARDLNDLLENSKTIILMLPSSFEVEDYCLGVPKRGVDCFLKKAKAHHVIVDMTTSDPASTRLIGRELTKAGIAFIDAPVTGGVTGALNGTLTLFIGGDEAVFKKVEPILKAVSSTQTHFGPLGLGHVAKAINNFICIGNLSVLCESLPLSKALGLDPTKLVNTLLQGTAASEMMKFYVPQILAGDFEPRFKLEHALKDLLIALKMANFAGAELPLLEAMLVHFENAKAEGLGGMNMSALIKPIEKMMKVEFRK